VGVSDEVLQNIIKKHKDKSEKQDLIAADISLLYGKFYDDDFENFDK
jgi:hypothetical protein